VDKIIKALTKVLTNVRFAKRAQKIQRDNQLLLTELIHRAIYQFDLLEDFMSGKIEEAELTKTGKYIDTEKKIIQLLNQGVVPSAEDLYQLHLNAYWFKVSEIYTLIDRESHWDTLLQYCQSHSKKLYSIALSFQACALTEHLDKVNSLLSHIQQRDLYLESYEMQRLEMIDYWLQKDNSLMDWSGTHALNKNKSRERVCEYREKLVKAEHTNLDSSIAQNKDSRVKKDKNFSSKI